jgi:hypothetical protein
MHLIKVKENKKILKLNIIEPWELGTEKAIPASIIDEYEGQYLIYLPTPRLIKGKSISYFLAELRGSDKLGLPSDKMRGTVLFNMVYLDEINDRNFRRYRIEDFRGNFLLGEIIF